MAASVTLPGIGENNLQRTEVSVRQIAQQLQDGLSAKADRSGDAFTGPVSISTSGLSTGLTITQALTGSAGLGYWNSINITSDNVPVDFACDHYIEHHYGSATNRGARSSYFAWNIQDTANTGGGAGTVGVGATLIGQSNSGDGGTNLTNAGVRGTYFGANVIGRNAGTNVQEVVGIEADLMTTSTSSARYAFGYTAANYAAVQGSACDAAFAVYSGGSIAAAGGSGPWGPGVGYHYGICFAELSANGLVPIDSGGTLMGSHVESLPGGVIPVAKGIDLTGFTFSSAAFQSNLFAVSQGGDVFAQNYWANGREVLSDTQVDLAAGGTYKINGTSIFASPNLTGAPTAPTQAAGDNSTKLATTAYADRLAPPWTTVVKTASTTITSNTTFADDPELKFAMAANGTYGFRIYTSWNNAAQGKYAVNGPTGLVALRVVAQTVNTTNAYDTIIGAPAVGQTFYLTYGFVQNGTTAGTFALRIAQNASSASATILEKGSWLEWTKLS